MVKCPYCHKELTKNEMFCYNCEQNVLEIKNKREMPGVEEEDH